MGRMENFSLKEAEDLHPRAPPLSSILSVSQSCYLIPKHLLRAIYVPGSVIRVFPSNDSSNPHDNVVSKTSRKCSPYSTHGY